MLRVGDLPSPRGEFAEAPLEMTVHETGEHLGEVGDWVDAMQLATLDESGEHCPVLGPLIRAGEKCVLSIESDRTDASLDWIGVELDLAIVEETDQPVPTGERVADRLGHR